MLSHEGDSSCDESPDVLCVELGGIEPPSIRHETPVLRPFPSFSLTQGGRRVSWPSSGDGGPRIVFPIRHRSFPTPAVFAAVIPRFCCRAAVNRPRAPLLVTMSLVSPEDQAARANCSLAILLVAPFSESEQLGSHVRPVKLMSKPVSPVVGCVDHPTVGRECCWPIFGCTTVGA